jgi:DNA-directed RNA polymerase specialized sigma24 family protein
MGESGHEPGSVSRLIVELKGNDSAARQTAVGALWQRFHGALERVAAARLDSSLCRHAGPEDIALEAILEFCAELARPDADRRFPHLQDRKQLWRLLVCFTARAAFDYNDTERRRRGKVGGESALGDMGFGACADHEPPPEFTLAVEELLDQLPDDTLRQVALLRLEGYSNQEIARRLGRAVTTVETKLKTIRAVWRSRGLVSEEGTA